MNDYLQPQISDFGLSKKTDFISMNMNMQSQKGMKGTPLYMAPEIFSEEKYTKSSDVYTLAFIVYDIMIGEQPFTNMNIYQLIKKVLNEGKRPEISEDVPDAYKQLIEICWLQDCEERPSFDSIVENLKNNDDFITDVVDQSEF